MKRKKCHETIFFPFTAFDLYNILICTVEITQLSPLACFNHTVRTNFFCNLRESDIFFSPYHLKDFKKQ